MPYKISKKGSGYKVCKKNGGKCFSKKPMSKEKAKAQMKAIHANESLEENISGEGASYGEPTINGHVATFNISAACKVHVAVKGANEDPTFTVLMKFQNTQDGEDAIKSLAGLTQDDFNDMGSLAIEAITGEGEIGSEPPMEESMQFESLFGKIFSE